MTSRKAQRFRAIFAWNFLKIHTFWPDCKAILAYGLMISICLSVRLSTFWLTFAFKFWNLLCNPAIPSSAVSRYVK